MGCYRVSSMAICCLWAGTLGLTQETKDPNPPEGNTQGIVRGPGPDAFGYIVDFSVPYQFIDISGTGTIVVSGDDVSSGPIPLPEPFNFYGTVYTNLNMATNGYLSTDPTDGGPDLSNDCPLPAPPSTGGGARFYPLHDDLVTASGYYQFFPNCPRLSDRFGASLPCHIFQWDGVTHFGGGGPFQFQTILYDGAWDIVYQVGAGNPEQGSGSTTGIQNDGASIGLTAACNTSGSIPGNFAVAIFHPNPEVCSVTCRLLRSSLTLTGECQSGADLWGIDGQGNFSLVQTNIAFSGSLTIDIFNFSFFAYILLPPGASPDVAEPIVYCFPAVVCPTLSQSGLVALLALMAGAGLIYMRRQRLRTRPF